MGHRQTVNNTPLPITLRWRRAVAYAAVLAVGLVLAGRVVYLQVTDQDFLRDQGDARHLRVVTMPAHRGVITDRNGEPLAVSAPVDSVWANPEVVLAANADLSQLAKVLDMSGTQLRRMLGARAQREFVYLRRHVDPEVADKVRALDVPGVSLRREYRRFYPAGEVTAHVLGFTDIDDHGIEGLELVYDEWLSGAQGSKRVIRDRLGRIVEDVESISIPQPGRDLKLSIDRRLQYLAYRELKAAVLLHRARSGSMVVVDVHSGEVLALVNQPSFNPNDRSNLRPTLSRNRALTDLFEPGSTVKPFVVGNALVEGVFRPGSMIDTRPGRLRVSRQLTVSDVRNYGVIDVATVIKKSSNVGVTKIAMATSPEGLWDLFRRVGFGSYPGTGFPGESAGTLPHFSQWGPVERATLAYGYGLAVTPVQLVDAYAAIAAGGLKYPISLLKTTEPPQAEQVLDARVAGDLLLMLEGVTQQDGTARQAHIPGYRVAGKTGTVKKLGENGYTEDRYLSVFAGIVPASKPRLAAVVMINEPGRDQYYGGLVAAPVFADVMSGALRLLDIPPDDPQTLHTNLALGRRGGDGA